MAWSGPSGHLFDEEFLAQRDGSQHTDDGFRSVSVAVGIFHAFQRAAEWLATSNGNLGEDVCSVGRGVEYVAGTFPSTLAHADVYRRQRERRSFHDSAAGVADHHVRLPQQAPIGQRWEIDEHAGLGTLG